MIWASADVEASSNRKFLKKKRKQVRNKSEMSKIPN